MSDLTDRVLAEHAYADRTKDSWTCKCGHSSGRRDWVHHVYEQIEQAARAAALADFGFWQDPLEPRVLLIRVPEWDDEDGLCVRLIDSRNGMSGRYWERQRFGVLPESVKRYFAAHPPRQLCQGWLNHIDTQYRCDQETGHSGPHSAGAIEWGES